MSPTAALPRAVSRILVAIALAAAYFAAGKAGLTFALVHESASAIWPPTGIAVAAGLIFGRRIWPAVFVAAWLVNVSTAGAPVISLAIATGNTLEMLVATWLVQRYAGGAACFERAGDIFRFVLLAALCASAVSAVIGTMSLYVGGVADRASVGAIALTWWLGDAVGALVVTPLIVLWWRQPMPGLPPGRRLEGAFVLALVVATATLVFVVLDEPFAYLTLAPLAWTAFRFGSREVATALALQAVVAVYGTLGESGPFVTGSPHLSLLLLQGFMGTLAVTLLPIAALVAQHRQALQHAAAGIRAKDEFLATLAHELRNPLAPLRNSVELLALQQGAPVPRDIIAMMGRQLGHLVRLIDDLLDVSRLTTGAITLRQEPLDLRTAVESAIEISRPVLDADGHALTVQMPEAPLVVNGDRVRLAQVISNLLNNAAKFTSPPGRIAIAVERVERTAVLHVKDNGMGIPREMLRTIFELFMQVRPVIGRFGGGMGVGLALVKRLVEMHGGSVEASSAGEGKGSEFTVRLPLADDSLLPAFAATAAERPVQAGRRRVLVVDDNMDAAASLALLLRSLGHETHIAHSGVEALRISAETKPDVALLDIGMPEMDGYELAAALRRTEQGRTMRIVAVTGWGQPEDRRRSSEAGFDDHLVKPVGIDALARAIAVPAAPISS